MKWKHESGDVSYAEANGYNWLLPNPTDLRPLFLQLNRSWGHNLDP